MAWGQISFMFTFRYFWSNSMPNYCKITWCQCKTEWRTNFTYLIELRNSRFGVSVYSVKSLRTIAKQEKCEKFCNSNHLISVGFCCTGVTKCKPPWHYCPGWQFCSEISCTIWHTSVQLQTFVMWLPYQNSCSCDYGLLHFDFHCNLAFSLNNLLTFVFLSCYRY